MRNWMRCGMGLACTVLLVAHATGATQTVPLDISLGVNYDLWITGAERDYAATSNVMVSAIFGQHSHPNEGSRAYAFQDQMGATYVGLPNDGLITKVVGDIQWQFQLCTNRGTVPEGGYAVGNRPTVPNVIWRSTSASPAVTSRIDLVSGQQGKYVSANFLFNGGGNAENTRYVRIYALYSTGAPQQVFSVDDILYAAWTQGTDNATNVVAHSVTRIWSQAGSVNTVRDALRYMHTFANPLTLDNTRTLTGFDVVCRNAGISRYAHMMVFGVSAVPVALPKTTLLMVR